LQAGDDGLVRIFGFRGLRFRGLSFRGLRFRGLRFRGLRFRGLRFRFRRRHAWLTANPGPDLFYFSTRFEEILNFVFNRG